MKIHTPIHMCPAAGVLQVTSLPSAGAEGGSSAPMQPTHIFSLEGYGTDMNKHCEKDTAANRPLVEHATSEPLQHASVWGSPAAGPDTAPMHATLAAAGASGHKRVAKAGDLPGGGVHTAPTPKMQRTERVEEAWHMQAAGGAEVAASQVRWGRGVPAVAEAVAVVFEVLEAARQAMTDDL